MHLYLRPSTHLLYPSADISSERGWKDSMAESDLSGLESSIKQLDGVLGCVVLANPDGSLAELQAFTRGGADRESVEQAILDEAGRGGLSGSGQVFVFELEAESHFGDRESLERAAELAEQEARSRGPLGVLHPLGTLHSLAGGDEAGATATRGRVPLRRVLLSSSSRRSSAEVTLGAGEVEIVGSASGEKSPHGLWVVSEAALGAAMRLAPGTRFTLKGAEIVTVFGRQAVLVLVQEAGAGDMLGIALVRAAPITEAAVRATLDAINRKLTNIET
ncbi:MAG: hypothetical protein ABR529_06625 [Actinomycetota bacterium]